MHKKISVGLTVTIIAVTIIVTAILTTGITMNIYSSLVSDLPEREAMYDSLAELDSLIRNEYYGAPEEESVNGAITRGYLDTLTVGKNYLMSAEEYGDYKEKQASAGTVSREVYSGVGYIRISDFADATADEFSAAVTALESSSVSGLVIDVRNTDSINIRSAALIIDMLVPLATEGTGAIATATDKNNTELVVFAADSASVDLPVSVIVNEKTSGAGELLACDIRDFSKGTVVGKTTAGNGSYQQVFELSDGGAVVLTTAKLHPYISDCYDGVGVAPDYEVDLAKETENLKEDSQFMQAYAAVTSLQ